MKTLFLLAALWLAETQAAPQTPTPPATGSISGMVRLADSNAPLAGAVVHIERVDTEYVPFFLDLNRKPVISKTGENGRFSFPELPAGTYSLWLEDLRGFLWMDGRLYPGSMPVKLGLSEHVNDVVFRYARRGSINGRVLNANGDPLTGAAIELACERYREGKRILEGCGGLRAISDTQGNYRIFWIAPGRYYVRTAYRPSTNATDQMVYFPGTLDEGKAASVEINLGSELTGIDFSLVTPPSTPSYTVAGKVVGLPVLLANMPIASVRLLRHEGSSGGLGDSYSNVAGDVSDGQFQIRGVRSGIYELWTQVRDDSGLTYTALATVEIAGANVDDVVVRVLPMVDLHGRIFIDGKPLETPLGPDAVPPRIEPVDRTPRNYIFDSKIFEFNRNTGEFTLLRVPSGHYKITYYPDLPNGYVSDVRLGNNSVSEGFAIGEDTPNLVEVFVSSSGGIIDGVVTGADSNPILGATVAIASMPVPGKNADWFVEYRTDKDGHFSMSRFPPGQYRIYAWMDLPEGDPWNNPDFMSRYELLGQTVFVTSGRKTTVRLTAIPENK